jgi:branched-chain amino acid transport system ATP-binding protein
MAETALLHVEDIGYAYQGSVAVEKMSLSVGPGEVVALLGANGAGKSTSVKMIAGVLRCRRGTIRFAGQDITRLRSPEVVEQGITLVPEGRLVFSRMTVLENLQVGAHAKRGHAGFAANLDRVFTLFPRLAERRAQLAGVMSGGEQQMLAIARGLMSSPRLLILDEPSLGLMPLMVENLFKLIASIRASGISLLVVEQNVHQTLTIADRGFVLEKGVVTMSGSGQELLGNDFVRRAFLGQ